MSNVENSPIEGIGSLSATLYPNPVEVARENAAKKIKSDLEAIENKEPPKDQVKDNFDNPPEKDDYIDAISPVDLILEGVKRKQQAISVMERLVESKTASVETEGQSKAAAKFLEVFDNATTRQDTFIDREI